MKLTNRISSEVLQLIAQKSSLLDLKMPTPTSKIAKADGKKVDPKMTKGEMHPKAATMQGNGGEKNGKSPAKK